MACPFSTPTTSCSRRIRRSCRHHGHHRMAFYHHACLLLLVLLSCAIQWTFGGSAASQEQQLQQQQPMGVITLNAKNFDSSLRDGNIWLIEFYAPWCSHCVRFSSTYEQLAIQLHSLHDAPIPQLPRSSSKQQIQQRKVNVAKVDGDAERALSSRFGVAGFPTFFLVDGWTVREYNGNRSKENLIQFALVDYKETDPIPFLFGPFGPMGQLKSLLMRIGVWLMGLYENLTAVRGMKPLMAMSVLCVGGLVIGLVLITVLGLMFLPKAKVD